VVALAGAGGSLLLSIGMGLTACPLCFYQRTFVLAIVGVLVTAFVSGAGRSALPARLALPAAVGGLGIAAFHVWLEFSGKLECPGGVLGIGTAPQQSLALFVVLTASLGIAVCVGRSDGKSVACATGVLLGALFAVGSIASAPPLKPPPDAPYKEDLTTCRVPYRPN
jgi:disulfide bond formation protein DsbB